MTETTTSAHEPDEIFNPFSAPEPGQPGAENTERAAPQAEPEPASATEDPLNVMFQAPDLSAVVPPKRKKPAAERPQHADDDAESSSDGSAKDGEAADGDSSESRDDEDASGTRRNRRKRRRGGRSKNRSEASDSGQDGQDASAPESSGDGGAGQNSGKQSQDSPQDASGQSNKNREKKDSQEGQRTKGSEQASSRGADAASSSEDDAQVIRRKRRRRRGSDDLEIEGMDDGAHTVTRIRAGRESSGEVSDKVTGVKGSTRLEAKRQRRRNSRDGGRRRGIITEAEFLARRESVDRTMVVRQRGERIQIGVLEDGVLAEHYVSHTTQDSLIGNVYLGKVQNVLPSMEAAFVDIGKGRNAVLYAGEVDWDAADIGNSARKIENALKSGDSVLVQVTKDPVGHKGARLTSQVSLPGRYLVYVPGGSMTGISRKLPDTERARLKKILKEQMPENAGVIVRTAAEGASEEELTNDINRLRSLWETIQAQTQDRKVLAPELLYAEPDLTIKVVRDVFNEDFSSMEVQGEETWDNIEAYVTYVAPHLLDRCRQWQPQENQPADIFAHHRIDEQLNKALERTVKLPSGGSLVFDRTEAMTVVDVNTGKFTGSGGNLEETVTKNNLEAAEEIVRQLRLRDIGGIIVIDFIDMVLEANRDLVLRRMVECLGRDRTKHQVAEVTSLGLVQMTRKRMGTGLLEVFSTECDHCAGRGIHTHPEPVEQRQSYTSQGEPHQARSSKKRRKRKKGDSNGSDGNEQNPAQDSRKLERASQGMAKVAAASKNSPEDSPDHADEDTSAQKSVPQQDSDQSRATVTIGGEPVEVPRGSGQKSTAHSRSSGIAPEQTGAGEASSSDAQEKLDALDKAVASRSEDPSRQPARRPRRRRAAGSAQGSGGEVTSVTTSTSGGTNTFSATAAGSAQPAEQSAEEPVMLGVGVRADEISRKQ